MHTDNYYYNGTKVLTLKDLNGEIPEIVFVCGNKTAGKTYYFKRKILRRAIKTGRKFIVLKRWAYSVTDTYDGFFKDLEENEKEFKGHRMSQKNIKQGTIGMLYYDGKHVGYVLPLSKVDLIKAESSLFVDVDEMFFDEFQSEDGKYLPNEPEKLNAIMIAVARGGGSHARKVRTYLCSNDVTAFNPYFVSYGISKRLRSDTSFLRGNGWVLEHTYNKYAADAIRSTHAHMAGRKELAYATGERYLLDSNSFVELVGGPKTPVINFKVDGTIYGIWDCQIDGLILISRRYDPSMRLTAVFNTMDHDQTSVLLPRASSICKQLKKMYEGGAVRFEDGECKNAFFDIVGLTVL